MDPADQRIRPLTLRQNFVCVTIGRGVYSACQWGLVAVLAKQSAGLLGRYALGVAICLPVFMFANLKLDRVLVTDSRDDFEFRDYVALRMMTSLCALLVVAVITLVAGYAWQSASTILAVALGQAALSVREVFLARARKAERMDGVAISHAVLGVVGLTAFAVVLYMSHDLLAGILTLVVIRLAVMLGLDRRVAVRIETATQADAATTISHVHWHSLFRLARLAAPLGVVGVLLSVGLNTPRYMAKSFQGEVVLGYLAGLASLPAVGTLLIGALGQAASPRLARYYCENRRAYVRLAGKMLAVGIAIGAAVLAGAYLFGRPVLTICFSAEFAEHFEEFLWVMLAGALMYVWSFMEMALTAARQFRVQVPIYATATCASLAAGWLLIPQYALLGAALTLVIVNAVGLLGTASAVAFVAFRAAPAALVSSADATEN